MRSLKLQSLFAVVLTAMTGVGLEIYNVWKDFAAYQRAQSLMQASHTQSRLARATLDLSLERSVTQLSLALDTPISPAMRAMIDRQRISSNEGFEAVQTQAATLKTSLRTAEFLSALNGHRQTLGTIRAASDDQLSKPATSRDPAQIKAIPDAMKGVVGSIDAARPLLRGEGFLLPTKVNLLEQLQQRAWMLREISGRERTNLAIATARGEALTDEALHEIKALSLIAGSLADEILNLGTYPSLNPSIRQAVDAMKKGYLEDYAAVRKAVIAPTGTVISFDSFFQQSSLALATIEQLMLASGSELEAFWKARAASDIRSILVNCLFALLFLAGSGAAVWLISRSFRQFDRLKNTMVDLSTGKLDVDIPYVANKNEVGEMAATVAIFKNGLQHNQQMIEEQAEKASQINALNRFQAVIQFGLDGTIINANENFLSVMGYSIDEIRGKHHRIFVDPLEASSPAYQALWNDLRAGKYQVAEYRRLAKGGHEVWIQASYNPIQNADGVLVGVIKFASDITERVKARQKRAEAQSEVSEGVNNVEGAVASTAQQATSVARTASEVSDRVNSVAAGTVQLSTSIAEINAQVMKALEVSNAAVDQAKSANTIVSSLVNDTQKISTVVDLISSITGQTNMLALNATIEAARAGDAGRGFAVVASEVKALAGQTAQATSEISGSIAAVQNSSERMQAMIDAISTTIMDINGISLSISSAVKEQAAVTAAMSGNMQEAAQGVQSISSTIEDVAELTREADKGVKQIVEAARRSV